MSYFGFQIQENSFRMNHKVLLKMAETVAELKKRNGEFVTQAGQRERKPLNQRVQSNSGLLRRSFEKAPRKFIYPGNENNFK